MRVNERTVVIGKNLVFVPYKRHHVEKYHKWMQCEDLLEKTASEPLSLEEEYEMQQKWCLDEDKCTFIVLNKTTDPREFSDKSVEIDAMIGDVNLFFNNTDNNKEAEIEVMIAEKNMRGKGLGKEATQVMMFYGVHVLGVEKYTVKIGYDNHASIKMFSKLGFTEISKSDIFREVTYGLDCTSSGFKENVWSVVEPSVTIEKDCYTFQE